MLAEAVLFLILARLSLALLSFSRLARFLNWQPKCDKVIGADRERLRKEVGEAVNVAAEHMPLEMVCFPRGIAVQAMLRRRGILTTLYYGVANLSDRGLGAHVWVQDAAEGVIGHHIAGHYTVLMQYPNKC